MARPLQFAWALALSACFTGGFLSGQPCTADADCGPSLHCEAGVCGGPSGQTSPTSTSSATEAPTTGTSAPGTSTTTTTTTPGTTAPVDPTSSSTSTGADETTGGGCGIGRCKDIDVLFVADNSPSMLVKTLILLDFISAFGSEILPELRQACSVHVGLTTTGIYAPNPPECQIMGALVQADNGGDACSFIEGHPYATLPDLEQPLSLQCMVNIGSEGNTDEQPIDALFSTVGVQQPGLNDGCNDGFYRPGAFLTVLMLTDEDDDDDDAQGHDGSDINEPAWETSITHLKPNGFDDIYMVGILGDPDPNTTTCPWMPLEGDDGFGAESAPNLRGFIQNLPADHHAIGTLCGVIPGAKDYLPLMEEIRSEIRAACGA